MSDMYYIGTIDSDKIQVNIPLNLSGIREQCVKLILKHCGIDIYIDFNWFDEYELLFYKIKNEDRYMLDNICLEECWWKSEINYIEFPIICDGIIHDNESYHIKYDCIIGVDAYSKFKKIDLSMELLNKILKDCIAWENNKSDWFYEDIKKVYNIISEWINNNEIIYWYKYY